jgi:capsular exopolysaccharide synthesis family protein
MNASGNELQRQGLDTWQVIRNRFGLIFSCLILVFAVSMIVTYIMPRKYRGRVEMRIERRDVKVDVFDERRAFDTMVMSEQWMKTEIDTITKAETLYPVVDALELQKHWNSPTRQIALRRLQANLDTQAALRSDMVTIEFYDEEPNRAAEVANAVADSYTAMRINVDRKQKEEALTAIKKQIAEQEALASSARERKLSAQRAAGIVGDIASSGTFSNRPGYEITTPEQQLEITRQSEMVKLNREIQALEAEMLGLGKLRTEQIAQQASALQIQNPTLAALQAQLNQNTVRLEGLLQSGLGRKHPTVLAERAQVDQNTKLIVETVQGHIAGLENKLTAALNQKAGLQKFNDQSKISALDQQAGMSDYVAASRELEDLERLLLQQKGRYAEEKSALELVKSPATIFAKAEVESKPAKPNTIVNLALGGFLGLMLGVGLAFGLESLDTTVRSLDDVERYLGVPVLAVVPRDVGVLHRTSGFTPDAEAYRILRTNLEFNRKNPNANCITVVSGGAGEGKSTTLTNLAFVCAQGGYNVLLIDADLRRPRLHTLFDVSNQKGLTNYLSTQIPLEEVVIQTPVENLYFLPSGLLPADSAGILNSQRMSELIEDVKARFDLVLIDSPPILGVSDASVLVNEADLTIIVVQHRKLPRQMLMRVKQAIENVGGTVLGVVLNNVDTRTDAQYQYYTSYYTYYTPTNAAGPSGSTKPRKKKRQPTIDVTADNIDPSFLADQKAKAEPKNQEDDLF